MRAILIVLVCSLAGACLSPTGVHRERARIEYEEALRQREAAGERAQSTDAMSEDEGTVGLVLGILDRLLVAAGAIWGANSWRDHRRKQRGEPVGLPKVNLR